MFNNLKEMFTETDEKHLREVAESSFSTTEAVNSILENQGPKKEDALGNTGAVQLVADFLFFSLHNFIYVTKVEYHQG